MDLHRYLRLFNPLSLLSFAILLTLHVSLSNAQSCSAENPCASGCCNKFGFCGLGPDYCKPDICVADCNRKAECDPGNFTPEYAVHTTCPLNACCSRFGFCGTTEAYCGAAEAIRYRTCGSRHTLQRVVGYYEGWAPSRDCKTIQPERIVPGVYTHINFAFATIDAKTFEVRPASGEDLDLYERLAYLKLKDPDLKIFIGLGGWTFNDDSRTATTFSDITRSEKNQKAFFKSLISFMSTHGFDGVDLDWEYPVEKGQGGRDEDFENLPVFIANLRKALESTGGRGGLSIKLPSTYRYLQNFDLAKLAPNVDFFNLMTYDLHGGTWNKTDNWSGPSLNAHTNLTEIDDSFNLLRISNISPDKLVFGISFHGRAFTAMTRECLEPGCKYASGAPRQACSNELGLMMNSEIVEVLEEKQITPHLDESAAVKIATFEETWLSYDDEETIKMKVDWAKKQCTSGVMVWAISQDTEDGKFSSAIGAAVNRNSPQSNLTRRSDDDGLVTVDKKHPQCRWTNCDEDCPSGWTRMTREDDDPRKGEFMTDEASCYAETGNKRSQFCCPPGDTPRCGWSARNNGKCDPTCPHGSVEVASDVTYCDTGYQAACCTTNTDSMVLYSQCSWADWPDCDEGSCSDEEEEVASSPNSGAWCQSRPVDPELPVGVYQFQERKYCCDQSRDISWADCEWYNSIGTPVKEEAGSCLSGCPSDRVRVALDFYWNENHKKKGLSGGPQCSASARAKCCVPHYVTKEQREPLADMVYRKALDEWLDDPVCDGKVGIFRRFNGISEDELSSRDSSLKPRGQPRALLLAQVAGFITLLLRDNAASQHEVEIWDDLVTPDFPNLKWRLFEWWLRENTQIPSGDLEPLASTIACSLGDFNSLVGEPQEEECPCDSYACCPGGGSGCIEEADVFSISLGVTPAYDLEARWKKSDSGIWSDDETLEERDPPRGTIFFDLPGQRTGSIRAQPYPPSGAWPEGHRIWDRVVMFTQTTDCLDVNPAIIQATPDTPNLELHTEHIIELNTISDFFEHAALGLLPSGSMMSVGPISITFFIQAIHTPIGVPLPPMVGGERSQDPATRIMNAFGSRSNDAYLVLAQAGLNELKNKIWEYGKNGVPISDEAMEECLGDFNKHTEFLVALREVITTINYIRHRDIWPYLVAIFRQIRVELLQTQRWYGSFIGIEMNVAEAWDEYFKDHLKTMLDNVKTWVRRWAIQAQLRYQPLDAEPRVQSFLVQVSILMSYSDALRFNLDDLP